MDFAYESPARYDHSDSEDESTPAAVAAPSFVVRLGPAAPARAETLVVSLLPVSGSGLGDGRTQVGVVYAPAAPPKWQPLGASEQVHSGLARIFLCDGAVWAVAGAGMPTELHHGWVRAVAARLQPRRIVVVDALDADVIATGTSAMNTFRSPAVLASAIVIGLAAAVLNYAETAAIPCRHLRIDGHQVPSPLGAAEINALFDAAPSAPARPEAVLRRDVSTSLYV
ncbi:hypothetical protein IWQ57_000396 [Coemansia nantahalensis]|uniref:Uncharacterized protein n=2 Tax=Coemansia TaxID=4863 RepID=A0ACC1LGD4_9FUNG|nr:hypothetical protein IWQ57_000396 [Coemansia nantahalensis]KAJ2807211.1 hypothetical protein H4R21_000564 [Coemansia helicoidea]